MREIRSQFESAGEGASGVADLPALETRCAARGMHYQTWLNPVRKCHYMARYGVIQWGGRFRIPPRNQHVTTNFF